MTLRQNLVSSFPLYEEYHTLDVQEKNEFLVFFNAQVDAIEQQDNELIDVTKTEDEGIGILENSLGVFLDTVAQKPFILNELQSTGAISLTVVSDETEATHKAKDGTLYRVETGEEDGQEIEAIENAEGNEGVVIQNSQDSVVSLFGGTPKEESNNPMIAEAERKVNSDDGLGKFDSGKDELEGFVFSSAGSKLTDV